MGHGRVRTAILCGCSENLPEPASRTWKPLGTPIVHVSLATVSLDLLTLEEGTRWLDGILDWAFQVVPNIRLRTHVPGLVQALSRLFEPALVAGLRMNKLDEIDRPPTCSQSCPAEWPFFSISMKARITKLDFN